MPFLNSRGRNRLDFTCPSDFKNEDEQISFKTEKESVSVRISLKTHSVKKCEEIISHRLLPERGGASPGSFAYSLPVDETAR